MYLSRWSNKTIWTIHYRRLQPNHSVTIVKDTKSALHSPLNWKRLLAITMKIIFPLSLVAQSISDFITAERTAAQHHRYQRWLVIQHGERLHINLSHWLSFPRFFEQEMVMISDTGSVCLGLLHTPVSNATKNWALVPPSAHYEMMIYCEFFPLETMTFEIECLEVEITLASL